MKPTTKIRFTDAAASRSTIFAERLQFGPGGVQLDKVLRTVSGCEPEQARGLFILALLERQFADEQIGLADPPS